MKAQNHEDKEPILIAKFFLNKNIEFFKEAPKEEPKTSNNSEFIMPTMRTIKEVLAFVKEKDPGSKLSERYVRELATNGIIPGVRVGNKKYLINLEKFIEFLNTPKEIKDPQKSNKYGIKPIY